MCVCVSIHAVVRGIQYFIFIFNLYSHTTVCRIIAEEVLALNVASFDTPFLCRYWDADSEFMHIEWMTKFWTRVCVCNDSWTRSWRCWRCMVLSLWHQFMFETRGITQHYSFIYDYIQQCVCVFLWCDSYSFIIVPMLFTLKFFLVVLCWMKNIDRHSGCRVPMPRVFSLHYSALNPLFLCKGASIQTTTIIDSLLCSLRAIIDLKDGGHLAIDWDASEVCRSSRDAFFMYWNCILTGHFMTDWTCVGVGW